MGQALVSMYSEAERLGSLAAKMKLAMLTRIPSTKAAEMPDDAATLKTFEDAMKQLKSEFGK